MNKKVRGIYRHYKGQFYEVIDIGKHSETLEEFVIYRCLYGDFSFYIRPKVMFFEELMHDNKTVSRFELIKELGEIKGYNYEQNNIHVLARSVIIDQEHILLCKTTDLATNFYYLPGGHVEHKESVETSLIREMMEETGVTARIKRFLGCLEYSFEPGHNSICHNHEYNFVFEVESEDLKLDIMPKSKEAKLELIWMPLKQLAEIDFRSEPLKRLIPKWLKEPVSDCFQSEMI